MNEDKTSFVAENSNSPIVLPSELDYSLLASDMRKFLNISSATRDDSSGSASEVSSATNLNYSHSNRRRKTHNSAYLEDYELNKCPLCSTNYHAKDTLAKHALRIHHKVVVALLQDGSTQQHLKCPFCVHKVMHKHQKLLLLHLEKKHAIEFLSFLRQSFGAKSKTLSPLSASSLHERMEEMSLAHCERADKGTMPSLLRTGTSPTEPKTDSNIFFRSSEVYLSDLKSTNQLMNHPYAKRKLVLDGSDSRELRISCMKENVPPSESLSTTLSRGKWTWKHALGRPFACGCCKEAFSCNALLLDHVSRRHRGPLRLLQPVFTCGFCSASFYKNSFLVRHCFQHHTPTWINK